MVLAAVIEDLSAPQHAAARTAYGVLAQAFGQAPDLETSEGRRRARAFIGFVPRSACGGHFDLDAQGRVRHDLRGDELEIKIEESPHLRTELWDLLSWLTAAQATLAFEGEGLHRGLHTAFTFTR